MGIFRKRFPGKASRITKIARARGLMRGNHYTQEGRAWNRTDAKFGILSSDPRFRSKIKATSKFNVKEYKRELPEMQQIAKERSKKAKQLVKARKKANAARKAGFVVKRRK